MSNELTNLMEQDQEHLIEKTDIESLALQCQRLQDIEKQIKDSEEHTKNLKTMYDQISSEIIPNMLAEQGLESLKLAVGKLSFTLVTVPVSFFTVAVSLFAINVSPISEII